MGLSTWSLGIAAASAFPYPRTSPLRLGPETAQRRVASTLLPFHSSSLYLCVSQQLAHVAGYFLLSEPFKRSCYRWSTCTTGCTREAAETNTIHSHSLPPASQPLQTQPPKQLKLAEAPFDDAQADLIIRSSDEVPVHFRVFKIILSLASPIFADMFSIPSPSLPCEKPHDEVQVVPLSEHSTALDIALRHIYPVRSTLPPKADPLHYASILAEFARKYQVETLDQFIVGYLTDSLERDPVGVYAIAVTYGYSDTGANAARSCLNLPFPDLESPYLRYATAEHTLELLKYHAACGEAASSFASSDRSWPPSPGKLENGLLDRHRGSKIICQTCSALDFNFTNGGPDCITTV